MSSQGRGAGFAAALVLEIVVAARRQSLTAVLEAASLLDMIDDASLPPPVRDAVAAAREIGRGAPMPEELAIDRWCDRAAHDDRAPDPATERDVVRWCQGAPAVGSWAADAVVPLLVDVALTTEPAWLESEVRAVLTRRDRAKPAGLVLDAAHRTIFHAVLAWRLGSDLAVRPSFGSHREEQRALAAWTVAVSTRDAALTERLLALAGFASVDELEARERSYAMDEVALPSGDSL